MTSTWGKMFMRRFKEDHTWTGYWLEESNATSSTTPNLKPVRSRPVRVTPRDVLYDGVHIVNARVSLGDVAWEWRETIEPPRSPSSYFEHCLSAANCASPPEVDSITRQKLIENGWIESHEGRVWTYPHRVYLEYTISKVGAERFTFTTGSKTLYCYHDGTWSFERRYASITTTRVKPEYYVDDLAVIICGEQIMYIIGHGKHPDWKMSGFGTGEIYLGCTGKLPKTVNNITKLVDMIRYTSRVVDTTPVDDATIHVEDVF